MEGEGEGKPPVSLFNRSPLPVDSVISPVAYYIHGLVSWPSICGLALLGGLEPRKRLVINQSPPPIPFIRYNICRRPRGTSGLVKDVGLA